MKGSRLLLVALLALGVGLGLLIAGAPWQTPNEPVKVVSLGSTTTARPATTTTTEVRVTTTTADDESSTTAEDEATTSTEDEATTSTEDTGTAGKRGPTTTTAGPLE